MVLAFMFQYDCDWHHFGSWHADLSVCARTQGIRLAADEVYDPRTGAMAMHGVNPDSMPYWYTGACL